MSERGQPEFIQRLEAFAQEYCRKQPSLGMISMMAWVLNVEIDFQLVPRDPPSPAPEVSHD